MATTDAIGTDKGVDDLDAILAITNTDVDEAIHTVKDNAEAIFTWDYEKGKRPALNKLYEKAKHSQWNGETDLDWSTDVDQEEFARMMSWALTIMLCYLRHLEATGSAERVSGPDGSEPERWRATAATAARP